LRLTTRYQGRLVPTVGAVLLFGTHREEFFSDAWIQCGCFGGTDKARILDQRDISACLSLVLEEAFEFVKRHTSRAAEFGELHRKAVWSVPLEAVRED
jgi:ATP-dependent DNA helicase RecG